MKIIEERNRLIKIKIFKQGSNQWRLLPVEKRDGSSIRKGEITFRGDEEKFRKLLMKLKAKDVETDPPSVKGKTYQQMIDTAKDGSDPYIWVWLTIWNKYRNDNKLTIAEREQGTISARQFLGKYLEDFINFYEENSYNVMTALDKFSTQKGLFLPDDEFEKVLIILQNRHMMENRGMKEVTLEANLIIGDYFLEKGDRIKILKENEVYHHILNMTVERRILNASIKKRINRELSDISSPPYYSEIPLDSIFDVLEKYGVVPLQEDLLEWSGILLGDNSQTDIALGDMSTEERVSYGKIYQPYTNSSLRLSWFKMGSGKYEIVCYIG